MTTTINPLMSPHKTKKVIKLVPPDGGWGWMVILGTALSNIFNVSMLSLFSLVYGDALEAMGHKTQGAAVVLSSMLFVSNFGGPVAGAIVKITSPRFTAVMGACFCTVGIFFSGFSTNIWHLVTTYGVLLGLGLDCISNSTFVSINSYFKQRKSQAVGLANVGTNIGQMLMPHVVRYLLENYGFRGTCLLLSALSFNGVAGCLLLQPVKIHMKKIIEEVTVDETIYSLENEQFDMVVVERPDLNQELPKCNKQQTEMQLVNRSKINVSKESTDKLETTSPNKNDSFEEGKESNWLRKLYDLFGIVLLSDIRFINIVIGTALTTTSIANFSLVYPLFLQNAASLDKQQTANCMSAVAAADMVGRLTLPVLQDKFKIKARWMLIMTAIWVIVIRQILAHQTDVTLLLALSILYGFGRSMTVVTKNITISENCKSELVPAAVGLGMLSMGIIAPPLGYFLGWIRDYTDSYIACIAAQNALLVILLVTWLPDMLYLHIKSNKEKKTLDPIKVFTKM
ncbi:unnamed protein product [Arctia plantaginis]|uniref:Uncharacterized protein n=1 Tax=Arctia plantaginis TaxID=874455 RepID=A0A8S1A2P2_ARCPL|nr:unnamed protein product [Arctia plantaginis]